MSNAVCMRRMTADEFLEWDLDQPEFRHELVNGFPVAMAGARNVHDDLVVNVVAELQNQLRRRPCRAFTGDTGVKIPNGNVRRPDAGVACGPRSPMALHALDPRLVVEVLSPSTRKVDLRDKLDEYRSVSGLVGIVMIDPAELFVSAWSRGAADDRWHADEHRAPDAVAAFPAIGVDLRLADIYEGVELITNE